jgi:hypothetical protein
MFKEGAGQMRGFRIVRDPDGILLNPFEYMGTQMGYVLTYGEGVPAVHDGNDWVVIVDDDTAANYDENIQALIIEQGTKIASAVTNPIYAELATQMGMYAGAGATTGTGPDNTTTTFGG